MAFAKTLSARQVCAKSIKAIKAFKPFESFKAFASDSAPSELQDTDMVMGMAMDMAMDMVMDMVMDMDTDMDMDTGALFREIDDGIEKMDLRKKGFVLPLAKPPMPVTTKAQPPDVLLRTPAEKEEDERFFAAVRAAEKARKITTAREVGEEGDYVQPHDCADHLVCNGSHAQCGFPGCDKEIGTRFR